MKRVARDLNPLPVMKIRTVVGHVQTVHRCRVFGDGGHELREDKIGCFPSTKGRGTASVTFVSGARALVEGAARMRITAPPLSSTSARERCCPRTRIDRLLPRCYPGTRKVVGATGFEPATPCAQGRCATRLRYAPTLEILNFTAVSRSSPVRVLAFLAKLSQNCPKPNSLSQNSRFIIRLVPKRPPIRWPHD